MSDTVDEEAIRDLPAMPPDFYARWRASTVGTISKRGARVVGIDSSGVMINAAKQHAERNPTSRRIRCSETPSICPKGADVGQMDRSSADGEGRAQLIVDHGLQD
jgi:hypothetical protein